MSAQETTPLLPSRQDLPLHTGTSHAHKHVPISVHASQSAWPWPGPKTLLRLRAGILAYLSALVPILVRYKAAEKAAADLSSWSVVFDFSTLTHILQLLWHLLSFVSPVYDNVSVILGCSHTHASSGVCSTTAVLATQLALTTESNAS